MVVTLLSVCVVVMAPVVLCCCCVEMVPVWPVVVPVVVLGVVLRLPLVEPLTLPVALDVDELGAVVVLWLGVEVELWVLVEGCDVALLELLELVSREPDTLESRPVGAPAPVVEEEEELGLVALEAEDEGCFSVEAEELEPRLLLDEEVWLEPVLLEVLGCCWLVDDV